MATLPVADCARLLGIHPKTLHHWLTQANVPVATHPMDARVKCVAEEHLQQVARMHGRPLQPPASSTLPQGACARGSSQGQAPPSRENEVEPLHTACSLPTTFSQEVDLIQKLSCLETKVITMQEQLAQLALALLQERERSVERRLSALETVTAELGGTPVFSVSLPDVQVTDSGAEQACAPHSPRQLNPAEQRARSRMPPLVEYAASGSYVVISSQEGELSLVPDSAQWFDWLATLSSFRFVGQQGRFTAYRKNGRHGQPSRSWSAARGVHGRRYEYCMGVTDHLTIACLEHAADALQARIESR